MKSNRRRKRGSTTESNLNKKVRGNERETSGGRRELERELKKKQITWKWHWGNVCVCRFFLFFWLFIFSEHPVWLSRIPQYLILGRAPIYPHRVFPTKENSSALFFLTAFPTRTICSRTRKMTGGERGETYSTNSIYLDFSAVTSISASNLSEFLSPLSQRQSSTTLAHLLCWLLSTDERWDEQWRVISKWHTGSLWFERRMSKCERPTEIHFKANRFDAIRPSDAG